MIASIEGTVASVGDGFAVVEVAGIGYLIMAPSRVLAGMATGSRARLLTQMVVREDSITLYGFSTHRQRDAFGSLLGVSGVGPRLALAVLSVFEPDDLGRVVASGDVDALVAVPGIGRRGAQRILMELKGRLGIEDSLVIEGSKLAEVREALAGLGYSPAEVTPVLARMGSSQAPLEELIRSCLRELGSRAGIQAGRPE